MVKVLTLWPSSARQFLGMPASSSSHDSTARHTQCFSPLVRCQPRAVVHWQGSKQHTVQDRPEIVRTMSGLWVVGQEVQDTPAFLHS